MATMVIFNGIGAFGKKSFESAGAIKIVKQKNT
jgi:hypothetical protein